jgi:hypothetical protein
MIDIHDYVAITHAKWKAPTIIDKNGNTVNIKDWIVADIRFLYWAIGLRGEDRNMHRITLPVSGAEVAIV